MNTPDQLLANILEQHEPQSLLVLGKGNIPALSNYLAENAVELNHFSLAPDLTLADTQQRFDLCLLTPEFSQLDKPHAIELLAGIRNRLCHRIYVFLPLDADSQWQAGDLYALGLKRVAQFANQAESPAGQHNAPLLSCFSYEIESYVKKRDWNNAKYWANPENFGKYWW